MDFQQIIDDLVKSGMTQQEIGREVGLSQASISALLTGETKEPRFTAGDRLRALHARRFAANDADA